ncbi:hypothetical protein DSS3PM1_00093 [Bacteriophage DSS3_PM1]|nr:hypothetical protein DSS3PM1_00093 [Bacteriophage DSS3_PM1]
MKLERIPESHLELPHLFAYYDREKEEVNWVLDSAQIWYMPCMGDGTNMYQVIRNGNALIVSATCWYHCKGEFSVKVTDLEPDEAVKKVDEAAELFALEF